MFLIGHRGGSSSCPENTLAAFQWVFRKGFSGIELDVHRTKDNQIVCLHDDTLRRTASRPDRAPAGVLDTPVSELEVLALVQNLGDMLTMHALREFPRSPTSMLWITPSCAHIVCM